MVEVEDYGVLVGKIMFNLNNAIQSHLELSEKIRDIAVIIIRLNPVILNSHQKI